MQLRIDSDEPLERVLDVVGAFYGVRLRVDDKSGIPDPVPGELEDGDQGITKPRH